MFMHCVCQPALVSACSPRYDLHEWIMTLHNALESFNKRKDRARERGQHRQRASSTSSVGTGGARAKTPPKTPPVTPPTPSKTTPTRRAPPPPPKAATGAAASKQGECPRRRPVRPAPAAPGKKKEPSASSPQHMVFHEDDILPPGYGATSQDYSEQFGGFHYEPHPILDLEISQTDHDYEGDREGADQRFHPPEPLPEHDGYEHQVELLPPPPSHCRSASDSLVMLHENAHSMPELHRPRDEHEKSTSPEDGSTDSSDLSRKKEELAAAHLSPKISHTRHLSLTGSQVPARKKRSKRSASLKRSRSPPELPPPPPPPDQDEADEKTASPARKAQTVESSGRMPRNDASSSSIGFSEVMNTISNIEHQLDEMTPEPELTHTTSPSPPTTGPPQQPTDSQLPTMSTFKPIDPHFIPVPEYPEGRVEEVSNEQLDFSCLDEEGDDGRGSESEEEKEMTTSGMQGQSFATPIYFYSGDNSTSGNGPVGLPLEQFTPEGVHVSPVYVPKKQLLGEDSPEGRSTTNGVSEPPKSTKGKKAHRVMFKDEVEDIPTYEPRVDEEIPGTVAELKMMLFGQREMETSKFRRGEPKHLVYYPQESGFVYEYDANGSGMPNHNNNNSGTILPDIREASEEAVEEVVKRETASSPELPPPDLDREEVFDVEETENVYDTPWDTKPASKYVNQGATAYKLRGSSPSGQKETLHFAEVSAHDGPIPGNMELRNVHSLERPLKRGQKSASVDLEGSSLLASISSTLQSRSKYGSDSLLSNLAATSSSLEQGSPPRREKQEVRSARAELEKIKAEHRRDPRYSPAASPRSPLQQRAKGRTRLPQHNGLPPRMASSLDELQRDIPTEVRYDASTHTHIYRSLV